MAQPSSSFSAEIREAWRYRELLRTLVRRELDVRYKNSIFGVAWSLANPIMRAIILLLVFQYVIPIKVPNYGVHVLATFFPWTYFLTGVLDAADSVSKQMPLVRKVYFPRELLPIATTLANLRHFLLTLGVVTIPLLVVLYARDSFIHHRLSVPPAEILLLPVLIIMQTLLIAGLALFLSALNVFFEDTKFLAAVIADLLFYAVPIIYFIEQVEHATLLPESIRGVVHTLFLLNPMVVILASYRRFLIAWPDGTPPRIPLTPGQPETIAVNLGVPWPWFCLSFAMCTAIFIFGYRFFNARKWRFVEAA